MADWGNMPKELITKIAEHLHYFEDFTTISCVCSSWRSAVKEAKFRAWINNKDGKSSSSLGRGREHTIPWQIYPGRDSSEGIYRIFSFYKQKFANIKFPIQEEDCNNNKKRVLSSYGWVIMVFPGHKLSLYNPYYGTTIELPEIKLSWEVHPAVADYCPDKLILSANPSTTSDFIVFLILEDKDKKIITLPSKLVYWRYGSGYDGWIQVVDTELQLNRNRSFLGPLCRDITFYQGEFYGVNFHGKIVKFETAQSSPHFQVVTELETFGSNTNEIWYYYLVESAGKLLVIRQVILHCRGIHFTDCNTIRFEVLELDVKDGKLKEVTNLGNRAIFTGSNSSFSVEVPDPAVCGFWGNSIYNLNDRVTWKWDRHGVCYRDACFYNMVEGLPRRFYKYQSRSAQEINQLLINRSPLLLGEGIPFTWIECPI